jgi:hypothetical protein
MANVVVTIGKDVDVIAEDILHWLAAGEKELKIAPKAIAALGVLFGAVDKVVVDAAGVATNPANIVLDLQTFQDVMAVWPDVKAFAATIGIKL